MSDDPRYRTSRRFDEPEREAGLSEIVEHGVRRIATALVIAGGLIGLGIYMSAEEAPTYQITTTSEGRIVRLNTQSGTVIACENNRCAIMLERGQDLEDDLPARAAPPQVSPPQQEARPALPAPGATPDNAAVPAPEAR